MHKNFVKPFIIIVALLVGGVLVWFHMQSLGDEQVSTTLKPLDTDATDQVQSHQSSEAGQNVIPGAPSATLNASAQGAESTNQQKIMYAIFHTNKGEITIEFFLDKAPNTVANFIKLAQSGFYDGV